MEMGRRVCGPCCFLHQRLALSQAAPHGSTLIFSDWSLKDHKPLQQFHKVLLDVHSQESVFIQRYLKVKYVTIFSQTESISYLFILK